MSEQDKIQAGARVRLLHDVSRYPHFTAAAGMTGTVVDIGAADVFAVRMDETVPGAETWENEVHWYPENGDDPSADLEVIPTDGASVRQAVKRQLVVTFDVTGLPEREVDSLAFEVAVQADTSADYTEDAEEVEGELFGHRGVPEPEVRIDPPFDGSRAGASVTVEALEVGKVYVSVSDPGPAFRVEEPMDDEHGPYVLSLDGSGGGYLGIEGSKGMFAEVAADSFVESDFHAVDFQIEGDFLMAVVVPDGFGSRLYGRGDRIHSNDVPLVRAAADKQDVFLDERAGGLYVPDGPVDDWPDPDDPTRGGVPPMSSKDRLDAVESAWYWLTKGEIFSEYTSDENLTATERLALAMWDEAETAIRCSAADQTDIHTGVEISGDVNEALEIPRRVAYCLSILNFGRA